MYHLVPIVFWYYPESDEDVVAIVQGDGTIVGFARCELMLGDETDPDEILARDHSTVARAKFADPVAAGDASAPQDRPPGFDLVEVDENALHPCTVRVDDSGGELSQRVVGCSFAAHGTEWEPKGRENSELSTKKLHRDL